MKKGGTHLIDRGEVNGGFQGNGIIYYPNSMLKTADVIS